MTLTKIRTVTRQIHGAGAEAHPVVPHVGVIVTLGLILHKYACSEEVHTDNQLSELLAQLCKFNDTFTCSCYSPFSFLSCDSW